jgi:hypothetical protein
MDQPRITRPAAWRAVSLRRAAAAAIALSAAATALAYVPSRFRTVDREVSSFAVQSPSERVLRAARGTDVDTGIFLLARRVIPPKAAYYVATGNAVSVSTPVTYAGASALGALYLLPRIPVGDPHLARYVISYGGDLGSLGVRIGRTWTYKPGLQVAEVAR